jgi:hypothetical protein
LRIELPSGAWVDVKDNTVPGDRFAIQDAPETIVEDGKIIVRGAASSMWKAFLARLITAWSWPVPIPAAAGLQVLDEYPPDEDDAAALEDALTERYDRLSRRRPTTPRPPSPTKETSPGS